MSLVKMIKEDTQASFTTADMSLQFLKMRAAVYCDDLFTTQASAKIVASFVSHCLCFELENMNFAELIAESITSEELSQNYVVSVLPQRITLLSEIMSLDVGGGPDASTRRRPLSGSYKVGSLARFSEASSN